MRSLFGINRSAAFLLSVIFVFLIVLLVNNLSDRKDPSLKTVGPQSLSKSVVSNGDAYTGDELGGCLRWASDKRRRVRYYLYRAESSMLSTDMLDEITYADHAWNFVEHSLEWYFYYQLRKLSAEGFGIRNNDIVLCETYEKQHADFFVFPYLGKLEHHHAELLPPTYKVAKEFAAWLSNQTEWKQYNGQRHVISWASGNANGHNGFNHVGNPIMLVVDRPERTPTSIKVPYRVPPYMYDPIWRMERSLAPSLNDQYYGIIKNETGWPGYSLENRDVFLFYRGTPNSEVRGKLVDYFRRPNSTSTNTSTSSSSTSTSTTASTTTSTTHDERGREDRYADDIIVTDQKVPTFHEYLEEMKRSLFCLVPKGHTPASQRFEESVLMGCIPVVISDDFLPAWHSNGDYFISHPEKDVPQLLPFLRSISHAEIGRKLEQVARQWTTMSYRFPPPQNGAFSLTMDRVVQHLDDPSTLN